jgi:hypothetical protein
MAEPKGPGEEGRDRHDDTLDRLALEIDQTAPLLRAAAQSLTGRKVNWEELRDAALEFAHVHDAYMLAQQGRGGEQLVGQFVLVREPRFSSPEYVGRVGAGCFRFWCANHGRELATRPDEDSYPTMTWEKDTGWCIDLSEVMCPEEDPDVEALQCVGSWVILEVPDPLLVGEALPSPFRGSVRRALP